MATDFDLNSIAKTLEANKFSITVELNERQLHDHLTSAIEGGSNYWARIDVGKHQPGWLNYFTAKFTEDSGETHELTLDKLKAGLAVMAAKYPHHFKDVIMDNGDAETGDVLVQCALFGEIVYG
jgi:hypothetical protein